MKDSRIETIDLVNPTEFAREVSTLSAAIDHLSKALEFLRSQKSCVVRMGAIHTEIQDDRNNSTILDSNKAADVCFDSRIREGLTEVVERILTTKTDRLAALRFQPKPFPVAASPPAEAELPTGFITSPRL